MTVDIDDLGKLTQVVDQLEQLGVEVVEIDSVKSNPYALAEADLWITWNND